MKHNLKNTTLAAMFLAIGLLPFLTGQIPQIGMLLPIAHPVLLCGWGSCPRSRSALFGAPFSFRRPRPRARVDGLWPGAGLSTAFQMAVHPGALPLPDYRNAGRTGGLRHRTEPSSWV